MAWKVAMGTDRCPRCETYLQEVAVRRADTGETKHVCRACARHLRDTYEGITADGLGPVPDSGEAPPADDHGVSDEEVRLYLSMRKHLDGNDYVTCERVVDEFGISPQMAGQALARLEDDGALSIRNDSKRRTYRIEM